MELRFEGTEIRVKITSGQYFDMSVINDDGETLAKETVIEDNIYSQLRDWEQEFAGG